MLSEEAVGSISIRPHHGMCLAYFQGKGYSEGFARHMGEMLEIFQQNVPVKLTVSTDEICSACPNNEHGQCRSSTQVAAYDRAVLEACGLSEGAELPFLDFVKAVQKQILGLGHRKEICGKCQWNDICSNRRGRWE